MCADVFQAYGWVRHDLVVMRHQLALGQNGQIGQWAVSQPAVEAAVEGGTCDGKVAQPPLGLRLVGGQTRRGP